MYLTLANLVLATHVLFVVFVIVMVPLIFLGGACSWQWVRSPVLRWFHLLGIGIVIIQSWLGIVCPLTTLEMWLRRLGGEETYSGGFIEHWMQRLLYWDLPWWAFVMVYTLFGIVVLSTWLFVPPNRMRRKIKVL